MSGKVPPPYPPEVREEAVPLVREGGMSFSMPPRSSAARTSRSGAGWPRQTVTPGGARTVSTEERAELSALRRWVRTLEQEKEILKKAAAWFAKETHSTP